MGTVKKRDVCRTDKVKQLEGWEKCLFNSTPAVYLISSFHSRRKQRKLKNK